MAAAVLLRRSGRQRAMGACFVVCLVGLSACGGDGGDAHAAEARTSAAVASSLAQQTLGADLLPPDADIAGLATAATDLPAADLSPDDAASALLSTGLGDDALPPA